MIVGQPVPVQLHSACLTGDVFGSWRFDCCDQLRLALARLESLGGGVILYMAQEGRGIGLANKMRAYGLQDSGFDTRDANTTLGFEDDERDYGVAALAVWAGVMFTRLAPYAFYVAYLTSGAAARLAASPCLENRRMN